MSALECIDSITVGYCDWLKKKELLFHSTVLIDTNEMIKLNIAVAKNIAIEIPRINKINPIL